MAITDGTVYVCDVCGYRWVAGEVPEKCAASKCRSRKWNKAGVSVDQESPPIKSVPAVDLKKSEKIEKEVKATSVNCRHGLFYCRQCAEDR